MRYEIRKCAPKAVAHEDEQAPPTLPAVEKDKPQLQAEGRIYYTASENATLLSECEALLSAPRYCAADIEPFFQNNVLLKPFICKYGLARLKVKVKMMRAKYN